MADHHGCELPIGLHPDLDVFDWICPVCDTGYQVNRFTIGDKAGVLIIPHTRIVESLINSTRP